MERLNSQIHFIVWIQADIFEKPFYILFSWLTGFAYPANFIISGGKAEGFHGLFEGWDTNSDRKITLEEVRKVIINSLVFAIGYLDSRYSREINITADCCQIGLDAT